MTTDNLLASIRSSGFAICNVYELFNDEWSMTLAISKHRHVIAWGKGKSFLEAGTNALAAIQEKADVYLAERRAADDFMAKFANRPDQAFVRRF